VNLNFFDTDLPQRSLVDWVLRFNTVRFFPSVGHTERNVYVDKPHNIVSDLKGYIRENAATIAADTSQLVCTLLKESNSLHALINLLPNVHNYCHKDSKNCYKELYLSTLVMSSSGF
jgi:hypothetical protein